MVTGLPQTPSPASEVQAVPDHDRHDSLNGQVRSHATVIDSQQTLLSKGSSATVVELERDDSNDDRSGWHAFQTGMHKYWAYEILSSLLCTIALATIVGILITSNGRPLPQWPLNITINAAISILAVVVKASMLYTVGEGISQLKWNWFLQPRPLSDLAAYDQASRGAWGASLFFWRRRLDLTATLGALLVVIALAVDPFAQQVVSFGSCPFMDTALNATIQRRNSYDVPAGVPLDDQAIQTTSYDHLLSNAILANLVDPASSPSSVQSASCAAADCSFTAPGGYYQTLTMLSDCQDVSDLIQTSSDMIGDTPQSYSLNITSANVSDATYRPTISYFPAQIPTGSNISPASAVVFDAQLQSPYLVAQPGVAKATQKLQLYSVFFDSATPLTPGVDTSKIGEESDYATHVITTHKAVSCTWTPAILTANSEVHNGQINTTEVKTQALLDASNLTAVTYSWIPPTNISLSEALATQAGTFQALTFLSLPARVVRNGEWTTCTNSTSPDANHTIGISTTTFSRSNSTDIPGPVSFRATDFLFHQPECVFQITEDAYSYLFGALSQIFPPPTDTYVYNQFVPRGNLQVLSQYDTGKWVTPDKLAIKHLLPLWDEGRINMDSLERWVGRIADTITRVMTAIPVEDGDGTADAIGAAYAARTCAYARWEWLSLPVFLTVVMNLFLVMTIVQSARLRKDPAWPGLLKSSSLGLLFFRPSTEPDVLGRGKGDPWIMERVAGRTSAAVLSVPEEHRRTSSGQQG